MPGAPPPTRRAPRGRSGGGPRVFGGALRRPCLLGPPPPPPPPRAVASPPAPGAFPPPPPGAAFLPHPPGRGAGPGAPRFPCVGGCHLAAARQADGEFGELADPAVDRDRAAMLLGDDVIADREAQPGALAGRLRREERLEQLVAQLGANAGAVVAHRDLDRIAEVPRRHLEGRLELRIGRRLAPLVRGVEAVAEQVEKHPRHILRHQLDGRDRRAEIALQRDVEILVLGARAVIGEVERLLDQRR